MAARLGSRVVPLDLAIAAGVVVACIYLPPGGRAGANTADLDPADLAARGWDSVALVAGVLHPAGVATPVARADLAGDPRAGRDGHGPHAPAVPMPAALLVAVYTVAVHTNRRTTLIVAAATAVTLIIPTLAVTGGSIGSDATYALAAFSALAAAVGDSVRNQRASVESALARAEAAEASREEEARRRVAEERLRIARELHDAVAHHVSVINVQAGVASHLLEADPPAARTALVHVRAASQEVIEEMRVMVGLLRTDGHAQLRRATDAGAHGDPRTGRPDALGRPRRRARRPRGRSRPAHHRRPDGLPGDPGGPHERRQVRDGERRAWCSVRTVRRCTSR